VQEIYGIHMPTSEVFILASINRPESLDRAILSRFTQQILIPLPDLDVRRRILEILLELKRIDFDHAPRRAKAWLKCPAERAAGTSRTGLRGRNKRQCSVRWSKAAQNTML